MVCEYYLLFYYLFFFFLIILFFLLLEYATGMYQQQKKIPSMNPDNQYLEIGQSIPIPYYQDQQYNPQYAKQKQIHQIPNPSAPIMYNTSTPQSRNMMYQPQLQMIYQFQRDNMPVLIRQQEMALRQSQNGKMNEGNNPDQQLPPQVLPMNQPLINPHLASHQVPGQLPYIPMNFQQNILNSQIYMQSQLPETSPNYSNYISSQIPIPNMSQPTSSLPLNQSSSTTTSASTASSTASSTSTSPSSLTSNSSLPNFLPSNNSANTNSEKDSEKTKKKDDPKPMSREQFYKIRPKMPKITKNDPRRFYANAFATAYNSCCLEGILEFITKYCTKDLLFIHRWVGSESFLNFPRYLEVRGFENVAEYWFSRCVVAPDVVLDLKETKLYVRSDGISTVLSSFTILCTRMYDGDMSDNIFIKPMDKSSKSNEDNEESQDTKRRKLDENQNEDSVNNNSEVDDIQIKEEKVEEISKRVYDKLNQLLISSKPNLNLKTLNTTSTLSTKKKDSKLSDDLTSANLNLNSLSETKSQSENKSDYVRKKLPDDRTTTLLGTIILHLNEDQKIRQMDLTFALQPDN